MIALEFLQSRKMEEEEKRAGVLGEGGERESGGEGEGGRGREGGRETVNSECL